jgi:hypothetical protein
LGEVYPESFACVQAYLILFTAFEPYSSLLNFIQVYFIQLYSTGAKSSTADNILLLLLLLLVAVVVLRFLSSSSSSSSKSLTTS